MSHQAPDHIIQSQTSPSTQGDQSVGEAGNATSPLRAELRSASAVHLRTAAISLGSNNVTLLPNQTQMAERLDLGGDSASPQEVVNARIKEEDDSLRSDVLHSDVQAVAIDIIPSTGPNPHLGDSNATGSSISVVLASPPPNTPVGVIHTPENLSTILPESPHDVPPSSDRCSYSSDGVQFPRVAQRVYMDADLEPLEVEQNALPVVRVIAQSQPTNHSPEHSAPSSPGCCCCQRGRSPSSSGCCGCQDAKRLRLFAIISGVVFVSVVLMSTIISFLGDLRDGPWDEDESGSDDFSHNCGNTYANAQWETSVFGYPDPFRLTWPTKTFEDTCECADYCADVSESDGIDLVAFAFMSRATNTTAQGNEFIGDCYCYWELDCMLEDLSRNGTVFSFKPPAMLGSCDRRHEK